jgi:glycerate kinase
MGKVPMGVLRRAQAHGVPVVLVAGQVSDRDALLRAGFAQVLCVNPPESPIEECLRPEVATSRIGETMAQLPSLPFL